MSKRFSLSVSSLEIPFKVAFSHAAATRNATQSILVSATSDTGITGYGEGCPRSYVTNETVESALMFVNSVRMEVTNVAELKKWVEDNRKLIDINPAAYCAIELALLDLFGKTEDKTIEQVLDVRVLSSEFKYTAVLGVSSTKAFRAQLTQYLQLGFQDFKLKLSGDLQSDSANLSELEDQPQLRVRADLNNLFHTAEDAIAYLKDLNFSFWALEEPISSGDLVGMRSIAAELGSRIVLDESFAKLEQASELANESEIWIPNLRVSKMGGLIRSVEIVEFCKKHGLHFIIGAQVGETSILTRAALCVASQHPDLVLAQEGAFGTNLLERDVVRTPLMFGKNGILRVEGPSGPGLGLGVLDV